MKILLIDDDPAMGQNLAKILEKEGFIVKHVARGQDGINQIKADVDIELVMLDIKLPGMDGLTVLKQMKEIRPNLEIIMVTAYSDYDLAIHALKHQAFDYLRKPIDLNDLLSAIGRYKELHAERVNIVPKYSLLLLDDEDTQRVFLKRVLEDEGYEVFDGNNGEVGMKIFEERKIDIVVTDVKMPIMSGMDVLYKIKRDVTSDAEVILVTGQGDQNVAIEALRGGAIDYLKKPIDLDELIFALQRARERLKLQRSLKYRNRDVRLLKEMQSGSSKEIENS